MRSSGSRVCRGGRRGSSLAASLTLALTLVGCGDNMTPQLAPARFVYDDGTEQIDRHQLFDRDLGMLCTPTAFSDGRKYCTPPTDQALYLDGSCTRAIGIVEPGAVPRGYFATRYLGGSSDSDDRPSHVFLAGEPTVAPDQLFEKYPFGCVAMGPPGERYNYDFYDLGVEVQLAQVRLEPWFDGEEFVVDAWRADALRVPTGLEECDLISRANGPTASCVPRMQENLLYVDPTCTQAATLGVPSEPYRNYVVDAISDCAMIFRVGATATATALYDRVGSLCVERTFDSSLPIALLVPVEGYELPRSPTGSSRIQLVRFDDLPLYDDLVRDTGLGTDCQRRSDGRCVPATTAHVETWFADAGCTQPIDVAMVRTGGCNAPMSYAEREGQYFPVTDSYTPQLYQLSTGDTCQMYNPPAPFVAHSIGPALGEDAFARATLMIE